MVTLHNLTANQFLNLLSRPQQQQVIDMLNRNKEELMGCSCDAEDYYDWVVGLIDNKIQHGC